MAIAPQSVPRTYQRPAARPVTLPKQPARSAGRATGGSRAASFAVCAAVAIGLIGYVSGYARMASVNYARVQILGQLRAQQVTNQLINTQIMQSREQDAVRRWAEEHGLKPVSGVSLVISSREQKGGQ